MKFLLSTFVLFSIFTGVVTTPISASTFEGGVVASVETEVSAVPAFEDASGETGEGSEEGETVRVVISDPESASIASEAADSILGANVVTETQLFSSVDVPVEEVENIQAAARAAGADNVEVDSLVYRTEVQPAAVQPTDPYYGGFNGSEQMNLPKVWPATQGANTVIAIVDTGVATVPELNGRVLPGHSLVPGLEARVPALDGRNDRHGTLSAVIAAGAMNNGVGSTGSCPQCLILPIRIFSQDPKSSAALSDVAAAIIWATNNGADVVSMSLSGSQPSRSLSDAVSYATKKGVILVAAAGNYSSSSAVYPAGEPDVLGVAGVDDNGNLYQWSNRGTFVNFAANGCNYSQNDELGIEFFCGTSSATPLMAGAAALYVSQNKERSTSQIRAALLSGRSQVVGINGGVVDIASILDSDPIGSVDKIFHSGPGIIRIQGWSIDPDTTKTVQLHTYINGRFSGVFAANRPRPDVGRFFLAHGNYRGYSETVRVSPGFNQVCVYAINQGVGATNPLLGCRNVMVGSGDPVGNFDSAKRTNSSTATIKGWSLDFDTTKPVILHVYVNGNFGAVVTANTLRADVGRAFPGYGNNHGFSTEIGVAADPSSVCVYAINQGAGFTNPLIGCRII